MLALLSGLLLPGGVHAQDSLSEFSRLFRAAVELGQDAHDKGKLRQARAKFTAAEALLPSLPKARRRQARWFLGVQRAELLLRAGNRGKAAKLGRAARALVRDDPAVYRGSYRVRLMVVLWMSLPWSDLAAMLGEGDEAAYLLGPNSERDLARAPSLREPLHILRADLLLDRGRDTAALELLRGSAQRLRDGDPLWRTACLQRLVNYYVVRAEYARARVYLRQLPDRRHGLYQDAQIALKMRDYKTAEALARELARMDRADAYRPADAVIAQLLGDALEPQGKREPALAAYRRAARAAPSRVAKAAAQNGIGDCLLGLDDPTGAQAAFEKARAALSGRASKLAHGNRIENWKDMGRAAERLGQPERAFVDYRTSLMEAERARLDIPRDLLGVSWLEPDFLPAVDGLLRTTRSARADLFSVLALMDQCKARGLLDWTLDPPRAEDRGALRRVVEGLLGSTDTDRLTASLRALEKARAQAAPPQRRRAHPLDAAAIGAMIRAEPGTLFLSYWVGAERVSVLAARGVRIVRLELGARADGMARLRAAYEKVEDPASVPWPALDRAAAFFLPPKLAREVQMADRIVFCPGPDLGRLPFEALRLQGRPVGLARPVEWAPSLSVRAALAARHALGVRAVVLDSVEAARGEEKRLGLSPLAFSGREGDGVAKSYGRVTRLRGKGASLAGLRAALAEGPADVVHVSAHAVAVPQLPSSSVLLLADGVATMFDMSRLAAQGALMVLSSCSSGSGEQRGGEGVVGLLWGPLAAGARCVVASLWMVNQQATADLMAQFHWSCARGADPAEAMRQARARLAASSNYAHPHYWAGFNVYGGGASRQGSRWPLPIPAGLLGAGLAALLLLGVWWLRRRG